MRLTTPLAFLFLVVAGINAEPMFPGNNLDLIYNKKIERGSVGRISLDRKCDFTLDQKFRLH